MRDKIFVLLLTVILVAIVCLVCDMLGVREYMQSAGVVREPIYYVCWGGV